MMGRPLRAALRNALYTGRRRIKPGGAGAALAAGTTYPVSALVLPGGAVGGSGGSTQAITTFRVTSATSGANLPWVFGHAFRQGDVPLGSDIVADLADFQYTVINRWPGDNSIRHALVAGRTTFAAPGTATITLSRGAGASGTALGIADLKAAIPASTSVAVGGTTMTLAGTFLDTPAAEVCTGPVVSNWVYRLPVAGSSHLVICCDVRLYKGGTVELFPWVENGFVNVAGAGESTQTCTVTVGGAQRFSQSIALKAFTRTPLVTGTTLSHWTSDPQITPRHDTAYLMASKVVPNYHTRWAAPEATLAALPTTHTVNGLGEVPPDFGSGGGRGNVIPNWQAYYLTSGGDPRAYRSAILSGLTSGSWSVHMPDTNTGRPLRFVDHASTTLPGFSGTQNNGGQPKNTHQPGFGHLPYILTGRLWFWEETAYWTTWNYLQSGNLAAGRHYENALIDSMDGGYTVRGAAWSIRSLAETAADTPSWHPNRAGYITAWENNALWNRRKYVDGSGTAFGDTLNATHVSPQGFLGEYSTDGNSTYQNEHNPTGLYFMGSGWLSAYHVTAWNYALDLGIAQSEASFTNHLAVVNHLNKQPISRAGDGQGANYNWRRFIVFAYPVGADATGNPPDTWYTPQQSFAAMKASFGISPTLPATEGLSLKSHSNDVDMAGTSLDYGAEQLQSLVYAYERGAPGSGEAWRRITGASNFYGNGGFDTNMPTDAKWAFWPRSRPAWVTSAPVFQWTEIPGTRLDSLASQLNPTDGNQSNVLAFSGASLKKSGSEIFLAGGGHADYSGNEVYSIVLNTAAPAWRLRRNTTPLSQVGYALGSGNGVGGLAYYADTDRGGYPGRPVSRHTYWHIQFSNEQNKLLFCGAYGIYSQSGNASQTMDAFDARESVNDYLPAGTYTFGAGALGFTWNDNGLVQDTAGNIYAHNNSNGIIAKWDPTRSPTNAWTSYANGGVYSANLTYAYDPVRNRIVRTGPSAGSSVPSFFDLNNNGARTDFTLTGPNAANIRNSGMSMTWCDARGTFLLRNWLEATTVYEMNPQTWEVTTLPVTGSTGTLYTAPGASIPDGRDFLFGRFTYVPELRICVQIRAHNQNIRFFRVD